MNIPAHLYDPTRLDCALTFLKKRLRKFFPNISDFKQMEEDLERRRREVGQEPIDYTKLKSFWDRVYALKFETSRKSWIRYLTSENYSWGLVEVPINQLHIMWPTVLANRIPPDTLGDPPYSYEYVQRILANNTECRVALEKDMRTYANETSPRDNFPLVGIRVDGKILLEDGNRRCRDAFLEDRPTLDVWVGEMVNGDAPEGYWLPTSWFWHQLLIIDAALAEDDTEMLQAQKNAIVLVLKRNSTARFEFEQMKESFFVSRHREAYTIVCESMNHS